MREFLNYINKHFGIDINENIIKVLGILFTMIPFVSYCMAYLYKAKYLDILGLPITYANVDLNLILYLSIIIFVGLLFLLIPKLLELLIFEYRAAYKKNGSHKMRFGYRSSFMRIFSIYYTITLIVAHFEYVSFELDFVFPVIFTLIIESLLIVFNPLKAFIESRFYALSDYAKTKLLIIKQLFVGILIVLVSVNCFSLVFRFANMRIDGERTFEYFFSGDKMEVVVYNYADKIIVMEGLMIDNNLVVSNYEYSILSREDLTFYYNTFDSVEFLLYERESNFLFKWIGKI